MRLFPIALLLLLTACADYDTASLTEPDAIDQRVAEADERMSASPAGQRVAQAIEAHGGLEAWYRGGPLRYTYAYQRTEADGTASGAPLATHQIIDLWSARAVHTVVADTSVRFGWTGEEAWIAPADAELFTNARFWALTPYYFVSMPFVLADPGVNYALAPSDTVDGRTVDVVRITFDDGTGDAPDDYYDLMLDPQTNRVQGVRYVVSYFNPDGELAETTMLYDGTQSPGGGIVMQEGFRSFSSETGSQRAKGTLTNLRFAPDVSDDVFAKPSGARVQEGK